MYQSYSKLAKIDTFTEEICLCDNPTNCILFNCQLLRNVTIASGGVLPKIHPELLTKKRGGKFVTSGNAPLTIPYKKPIATKPPLHKKVI